MFGLKKRNLGKGREVCIVKPRQKTGDLKNNKNPKRAQSDIIRSSNSMNANTHTENYQENLRHQRTYQRVSDRRRKPPTRDTITALWVREWLSPTNCSLRPRSVEATTDLQVRHCKEQQLAKKGAGKGHQINPMIRLSKCRQTELLRQVLNRMFKSVLQSLHNPHVGNCNKQGPEVLTTIKSAETLLKTTPAQLCLHLSKSRVPYGCNSI